MSDGSYHISTARLEGFLSGEPLDPPPPAPPAAVIREAWSALLAAGLILGPDGEPVPPDALTVESGGLVRLDHGATSRVWHFDHLGLGAVLTVLAQTLAAGLNQPGTGSGQHPPR